MKRDLRFRAKRYDPGNFAGPHAYRGQGAFLFVAFGLLPLIMRRRQWTAWRRAALLLPVALVLGAHASTVDVITNGTFESGTTTGWTPSSSSFGTPTTGCNDPFTAQLTGTGCYTGFNPADGHYAAYLSASVTGPSQTGGYDDEMVQDFSVPSATIVSATLSFDGSYAIDGSGNFDGAYAEAALFQGSTFLNDLGMVGDPGPAKPYSSSWNSYSLDITSLLQSHQGQTLALELDAGAFYDTRTPGTETNNDEINAGFDNIAIDITTASPTPEPSGLALGALGLLLAAAGRVGAVGRRGAVNPGPNRHPGETK